MINILLVLIAVINRNTVSIGILAVAMSMAAQMTMDLLHFIVEWTSESHHLNPQGLTIRCRDVYYLSRANQGIRRSPLRRKEAIKGRSMVTTRCNPIQQGLCKIQTPLTACDTKNQFRGEAR